MQRVILNPGEPVLLEARTLDASLLGDYKEGLNSYSGKARKALDIFPNRRKELVGSNCFAPIELKKYLPEGVRLATMADLGKATEINPNFLKNFYSDTGIVLKTVKDSYQKNNFLVKDLVKQLKKREINLKYPKIIYFDALDLRQDENSVYGLAYDLSERAELGKNIFDAPGLRHNYCFKTIHETSGIPIKHSKGNRATFIKRDGLDWFCLNDYSFVGALSYSNERVLDDSNNSGRVVVVSKVDTE